MSVLTHANREWERRPADERFGSLADMHDAARAFHDNAAKAILPVKSLSVRPEGDSIVVTGSSGLPACLTHFTFGQLAGKAGAPAGYLRTLPATLASDCINTGLRSAAGEQAMLLFDRRNGLQLRGLTSEKYARIWNSDVTARLLQIEAEGPWQPAPAAFDGSRGLYLGDRDMFAFLVDNNRRIFEKGPAGGLSRGFFMWNSKVGARSIGIMTFLYEFCCGNHRVWGASNVKEMSIAHIHTDTARAFGKLAVELKRYAESSAEDDEAKVLAAHRFQIAATKEEVIDAVFKLAIGNLSRSRITEAYDLAERRTDWYGSPRTAWGLAGGLTEIARDLPNADERHALDRAGGKVMEMAF
jgi:Domain of unknown function (DUF932)